MISTYANMPFLLALRKIWPLDQLLLDYLAGSYVDINMHVQLRLWREMLLGSQFKIRGWRWHKLIFCTPHTRELQKLLTGPWEGADYGYRSVGAPWVHANPKQWLVNLFWAPLRTNCASLVRPGIDYKMTAIHGITGDKPTRVLYVIIAFLGPFTEFAVSAKRPARGKWWMAVRQ